MPITRVPVGGQVFGGGIPKDLGPASALLGVYQRSFPFENVPATALGIRSGGSVITLLPPQADFDTGVGANKICEVVENIQLDPMEQTLNGESFFLHTHVVRAIFRNSGATNPTGECFSGIELGSMNIAPPWQSGWPAASGCIQLRYDFTNSLWEIMIYDGDTAPTRQTCLKQPSFPVPWVRELMIVYKPLAPIPIIEFYIDALLVHTYVGPRFLPSTSLNGPPVCLGGGGIFNTSGSNAAGRNQTRFSFNQFLTYYQRADSPD